MDDELYSVCSVDLDNTLVLDRRFSAAVIRILKIAANYGIPLFGATNRSIKDGLTQFFGIIKSCNESSWLEDKKLRSLGHYRDFLRFSSFRNITQLTVAQQITVPFIFVTPFDYFLPSPQQGKYYQVIEQVMDYMVEQIEKVLKKSSSLDTLQKQVETMLQILRDEKSTSSELLTPEKDEIFDEKFSEIKKLLEQEKDLESQYKNECRQSRLAYKDIHFLWISQQIKCKTLVHLEDNDVIYKYMGKQHEYDLELRPHIISKDTAKIRVYCLPFNPGWTETDHNFLVTAMIAGLNQPVYEIMSNLRSYLPCCWCFLSSGRTDTIRRVSHYLNALLISSEQKKPTEQKTTAMPPKICTSDNRDLCKMLTTLPFQQINKIKDSKLIAPFEKLQEELAKLESLSAVAMRGQSGGGTSGYLRLENEEGRKLS